MLANLVDFPWHLAGAGVVWALALGRCLVPGGAELDQGAEVSLCVESTHLV